MNRSVDFDTPATFTQETARFSQTWLKLALQAATDPQAPLPPRLQGLTSHSQVTGLIHDLLASQAQWASLYARGIDPQRHQAIWGQAAPMLGKLRERHPNWLMTLGATAIIESVSDELTLSTWLQTWDDLGYWPTSVAPAHSMRYDEAQMSAARPHWHIAVLKRITTWAIEHWSSDQAPIAQGWAQVLERMMNQFQDSQPQPETHIGFQHAQITLMVLMSSQPTLAPSLRPLAERQGLGWPQSLGGNGLRLLDQPLLLPQPHAPSKWAWSGVAEHLHAAAATGCLGQPFPRETPFWAICLLELWKQRASQPAAAFVDHQGQQGWAAWIERHSHAYSKTLPKPDYPTGISYPQIKTVLKQRDQEFIQQCRDQAQAWITKFRQWQLELLVNVTPSDAPASRGRVRARS